MPNHTQNAIRKYLAYLKNDRGAQIAFLVSGLSWLMVFGIYDIVRMFQLMFPTVLPNLLQSMATNLLTIMDAFSSVINWYPRLKQELGLDLALHSLESFRSRRSRMRAELICALFTAGLLSVALGVLGTAIYETTKLLKKTARDSAK